MEMINERECYSNKTILITGACGTVGSELLRQVVLLGAARVICFDSNESNLFFLQELYKNEKSVETYLGDVRDLTSLNLRMKGVDVVLHAAALKHVGLCEESPEQAIQTNILGTQNLIHAAQQNNVSRVIFTSSDKAVNPTNVMGTSKLMGERLMTAAAMSSRGSSTIFASVRFGNIVGSSGSVVPLFVRQIESGLPVTLTDPSMTRFIMTVNDAVSLVLKSGTLAAGGEVFVTKMPVANISDLAAAVVKCMGAAVDYPIREIGAKPGEKFYEELMNDEEMRRSYELDDMFVVTSAFDPSKGGWKDADLPMPHKPYNSSFETTLSEIELLEYLETKYFNSLENQSIQ